MLFLILKIHRYAGIVVCDSIIPLKIKDNKLVLLHLYINCHRHLPH